MAKTPCDADYLPVLINFLAYALLTRYGRMDDDADLHLAIEKQEYALSLCEADSFYYMQCMHNLGSALCVRYKLTEELADLDRAVALLERAVELLEPVHM